MNVIVNPRLFDRRRLVCLTEPYLLIKGVLQNTWKVVSVKAADLQCLSLGAQTIPSHDFR